MKWDRLATFFAAGVLMVGGASSFSYAEDMKDETDKNHTDKPHADDSDDAKHEEVAVADLPKPVADAFKKDYPDATIVKAERETYKDNTVHYEIDYKDKDGKEHEIEYSATGEKLEDK